MSRPDEKNEIARIFACRTVAVMHFTGRIESLKPFIVSGVLWSVQSISPTETQKSLFCVRPWSLLPILVFSKRGPTETTVF